MWEGEWDGLWFGDWAGASEDGVTSATGTAVGTSSASATGVAVGGEQPSGGWAAFNDAQIERNRRRRRELEEEADRLEMLLAQEGLVTPDPVVEARHTVREYSVRRDFSRRTQRAIAYAERARSAAAYQLALREIAKQLDEEEMALLLVLAMAA